jgi:hypothetical protein
MPNITVSERSVGPKLDQGLISGLIAGAVVSVWMILIGALGSGTAADHGVAVSAAALGNGVFDSTGFGLNWLVGEIVHFVTFAFLGLIFALVWPRIRQYGTWTPALLFGLVSYVVIVQVISRLISPEMANHLTGIGLILGYLFAGITFAIRYRRA